MPAAPKDEILNTEELWICNCNLACLVKDTGTHNSTHPEIPELNPLKTIDKDFENDIEIKRHF